MKRLPLATFAILLALSFSACATRLNIPYDLSPEELIQRAQEASDRNRFNHALQLYEALLERNQDNLALVVNAEYEIGFIHERRRNFDEARIWLNRVLERYEAPGGEALPEKFRVLAQIVLERVEERDRGRRPRTRQHQQPEQYQLAQQPEHPPLVQLAQPVQRPEQYQLPLYGLESALEDAAEEVSRNLDAMSRIAVVYVLAPDSGTANFIADELEYLLHGRGFTIVDRSTVDLVRAERQLGLTGDIDDDIAAQIGYFAGASVVITGGIVGEGDHRWLYLRAVDAITAQVVGTAFEAF